MNENQQINLAVMAVLAQQALVVADENKTTLPQPLMTFLTFIVENFKPFDETDPQNNWKTTTFGKDAWDKYSDEYKKQKETCLKGLGSDNISARDFLSALTEVANAWSCGTTNLLTKRIFLTELFGNKPGPAESTTNHFKTTVTDFFATHNPGLSLPTETPDRAAAADTDDRHIAALSTPSDEDGSTTEAAVSAMAAAKTNESAHAQPEHSLVGSRIEENDTKIEGNEPIVPETLSSDGIDPSSAPLPVTHSLPSRQLTAKGYLSLNVGTEESTNDLTIYAIAAEGAADKAGLKVNDKILSIDNQDFGTTSERHANFVEFMQHVTAGQVISIQVLRGTEKKEFPVTLSSELIKPALNSEEEKSNHHNVVVAADSAAAPAPASLPATVAAVVQAPATASASAPASPSSAGAANHKRRASVSMPSTATSSTVATEQFFDDQKVQLLVLISLARQTQTILQKDSKLKLNSLQAFLTKLVQSYNEAKLANNSEATKWLEFDKLVNDEIDTFVETNKYSAELSTKIAGALRDEANKWNKEKFNAVKRTIKVTSLLSADTNTNQASYFATLAQEIVDAKVALIITAKATSVKTDTTAAADAVDAGAATASAAAAVPDPTATAAPPAADSVPAAIEDNAAAAPAATSAAEAVATEAANAELLYHAFYYLLALNIYHKLKEQPQYKNSNLFDALARACNSLAKLSSDDAAKPGVDLIQEKLSLQQIELEQPTIARIASFAKLWQKEGLEIGGQPVTLIHLKSKDAKICKLLDDTASAIFNSWNENQQKEQRHLQEQQRSTIVKAHLTIFKNLAQQTLATAAKTKIDLAELGECLQSCIFLIEIEPESTVQELSGLLQHIRTKIENFAQLQATLGNDNFKFSSLTDALFAAAGLHASATVTDPKPIETVAEEIFMGWTENTGIAEAQLYTPLQQQATIAIFEIELKVASRRRGRFFNSYSDEIEKWLRDNFREKTIEEKIAFFFENAAPKTEAINKMLDPLKYNFEIALKAVKQGQYDYNSSTNARSFKIKMPAVPREAAHAAPAADTSSAINNRDEVKIDIILGTLALAFKGGFGRHSKAFADRVVKTTEKFIEALRDPRAMARDNLTTKAGSNSQKIANALRDETITYRPILHR